uniref:Uncharacterized protein n=1 Tax=Romanomermis culicivorax TaxID=13658 RepID=A0A915J9A6_ROMCU
MVQIVVRVPMDHREAQAFLDSKAIVDESFVYYFIVILAIVWDQMMKIEVIILDDFNLELLFRDICCRDSVASVLEYNNLKIFPALHAGIKNKLHVLLV